MMFTLMLFLLLINLSEFTTQLIFTSLTMPNKDNPVPSSPPNQQQSGSSMLNYYHHPYYHIAFNDSDSIPDEQRLMAQLLRNYDPSARPVYNASNTVSVAFGIALTQLSDMVSFHSTETDVKICNDAFQRRRRGIFLSYFD